MNMVGLSGVEILETYITDQNVLFHLTIAGGNTDSNTMSSFTYGTIATTQKRGLDAGTPEGHSHLESKTIALKMEEQTLCGNPKTPDQARMRSTSRLSRRDTASSSTSHQSTEKKDSWITEPTATPTSISSFSFGTMEPVPMIPSPYRTAKQRIRPSQDPETVQQEWKYCNNEGPSILKTSNPYDMSSISIANSPGIKPLRSKSSRLSEEDDRDSFYSCLENGQDTSRRHDVANKNIMDIQMRNDAPTGRGPSLESNRSAATTASILGPPPNLPLPTRPPSAQLHNNGPYRLRSSSETDRIAAFAQRRQSGSTLPQYVSMPVKPGGGDVQPMMVSDGKVSPFSFQSVPSTPVTSTSGFNGKSSTDPLLFTGFKPNGLGANGMHGQIHQESELDDILEAVDLANETFMTIKASNRVFWLSLVLLLGLWGSWVSSFFFRVWTVSDVY